MSVCLHGSDSKVRSQSSGPVICDISSTSKPMAYAQISKMWSSLAGSGWRERGELVELDHRLVHALLYREHPLPVASRVLREALGGALGLLADEAVRTVAEGRGQDHGARPEAEAVALEVEVLDHRRVAREAHAPRAGCRASPPMSRGCNRRTRALEFASTTSTFEARPLQDRRPAGSPPTGPRRPRPRRIRPSWVAQLMPLARCGRISRHEWRGHARRDRHRRRERHRRRDLRTAGRARVARRRRLGPEGIRDRADRSRWTSQTATPCGRRWSEWHGELGPVSLLVTARRPYELVPIRGVDTDRWRRMLDGAPRRRGERVLGRAPGMSRRGRG